jgi:hypothetical protein
MDAVFWIMIAIRAGCHGTGGPRRNAGQGGARPVRTFRHVRTRGDSSRWLGFKWSIGAIVGGPANSVPARSGWVRAMEEVWPALRRHPR